MRRRGTAPRQPGGVGPSWGKIFARGLLRWFARHGRDLPWRRTRDPYRILVSEMMLQQTQVPRVLAYYPRFLRRYPTVEALAKAPPARVREAWEGLGYYARAHNLQAAARTVVRERGGRFPRTQAEAERLPGVGRYTSGALLAFAFEEPVPALDTNGTRVLSRLFVARRSSSPSRTAARLEKLATSLIPAGKAWAFNQALMDFGALVCTARAPRCDACPFRSRCRAYARWQRRGRSAPGGQP